jgi:hypothetical protein
VIFLRELSKNEYTLILKMDEQWRSPGPKQIQETFDASGMPPRLIEKSNSIVFAYGVLNQPEMFYVFLEHLYHLGLVQYINEPAIEGEYKGVRRGAANKPTLVFIRLSSFGGLFYKACVSRPGSPS